MPTRKVDNSKFHTNLDTVRITNEINDTILLSRDEYNLIVDEQSEFLKSFPENPDEAYYYHDKKRDFTSEVGQDYYYELYAYFLKKKNGDKQFVQERKKLIAIYSNINSLFAHFQYGGTYFGHQIPRILAYAEYSVFLLPKEKYAIEKTYDITIQKQLYIKSLRQLIKDESKIDFNTLGEEKNVRSKELNKTVDELDSLITNNFYLRRTQEFQYGHYEYY